MMARLVSEKEAAEAIGVELATFRAWVSCGRLPGPIPDCDKYDLKAIDAAVDRISGLGGGANALDVWRAKGGKMRVQLKGIHKIKAKATVYYYAWRGGPRLVGEPGSPEFLASYSAAHASRREPDRASFHSIIAGYQASQDFIGLKARTKADYLQHIGKIEQAFATLPLAALDDARVTRDFLE